MRQVAYVMSRDGEPSAHIYLYNDGGILLVIHPLLTMLLNVILFSLILILIQQVCQKW